MEPTSIYRVANPDTIMQSVQRLKATGMTQVEVATSLGKGIATIMRHWSRASTWALRGATERVGMQQ